MNNYLNLHILTSLAFANPNRDDAGAPKSAIYGGVERARMSSQSLKRAARIGYEQYSLSPTYRSAAVGTLVSKELRERGHVVDDAAEGLIDQAVRHLVEDSPKNKRQSDDDLAEEGAEAGATLMWLSKAEVSALADTLKEVLTSGKLPNAKALRKKIAAAVREPALPIAMFGRMFAASPDSATDAAVQVSHAISTHQHGVEVDYFTAVDDLRAHGAGHLGLAMFVGAVYYRHVCIDRAQLQATMGNGLATASNDLEHMLRSLVLELPSGKQNSAAHQSLPSLVLAMQGPRPANCVEAFEKPVQADSDGYVQASAQALRDYIVDVSQFYGDAFGESRVAGRSSLSALFAAETTDLPTMVDALSGWLVEPAR